MQHRDALIREWYQDILFPHAHSQFKYTNFFSGKRHQFTLKVNFIKLRTYPFSYPQHQVVLSSSFY